MYQETKMSVQGFAKADETISYAQRFIKLGKQENAYACLGKSNLTVSKIGFGGYRVHHALQDHRESLKFALLNGINLIDTSSNYTDGNSEILIGEILRELIQQKQISRSEIVVVSKVGYIQGKNFDIVEERKQNSKPFPEMVEYSENCWHCIHTDFMKDQLERSLQRLQLDRLDVYLLHNPEYFFLHAMKSEDADLTAIREEFYTRIKQAFIYFERAVKAGQISWYGVSSNSFGYESQTYEFVSVENLLSLAKQASKIINSDENLHHFSVAQAPMNLYEADILVQQNQMNASCSFLSFCRDNHIGVLVNRPLNAFHSNKLHRMVDYQTFQTHDHKQQILLDIQNVSIHEQTFHNNLLSKAQAFPSFVSLLSPVFEWGKKLAETVFQISTNENIKAYAERSIWKNIIETANDVEMRILNLSHQIHHEEKNTITQWFIDWQTWLQKYRFLIGETITHIEQYYHREKNELSQMIHQIINEEIETDYHSLALDQKSLLILTSIPEISSVLTGLRRVEYCQKAFKIFVLPPIAQIHTRVESIYRKIISSST